MFVRLLEELSMNAWPSLQDIHYDGWVIRYAAGYSKRANSVYPLYPGTKSLRTKLRACEAFFRQRGLPAIFKMTAAAVPPNLDEVLAGSGYRRSAEASVQGLVLRELPQGDSEPLTVERRLGPEWLADYGAMTGLSEDQLVTLNRMLDGRAPERFFVRLREGSTVAACGMGVLDNGYFGLFDLVVDPAMRGQGFGKRLVTELLRLGRQHGARQAWLQVMKSNAVALNLYQQFGFKELYPYWFREKAL